MTGVGKVREAKGALVPASGEGKALGRGAGAQEAAARPGTLKPAEPSGP